MIEFATETDDINMETDLTTSRLTKRVINDLPTTASPGTKQSDFGTTTNVTGMMQSRMWRTILLVKPFCTRK